MFGILIVRANTSYTNMICVHTYFCRRVYICVLYVLYSFVWCRYGVGYHMVVVKETGCVSSRVAQIVTSMVPGSKNVTDVGTELSFVLPSTSSHHFPELFEKLECKQYIVGGHSD